MNPPTQQCADSVSSAETAAPLALVHPVSATVCLTALQAEGVPRSEWSVELLVNADIRRGARMRTRTRLTVSRWAGNVETAARIAAELADNAAKHGQPFFNGCVILRLGTIPESGELVIRVDDANPVFSGFEEVKAMPRGVQCGLGFVQHQQARLDWHVLQDDDGVVVGKTVKAFLPVTETEAA
ncbi:MULTISPECIES: sensor histidine kinase [unclassified Streptomyces]|uniref:sensor histidine kinase n=1 Tax=unclassified Streptomyces TaxID=2593676 RepID=UPI000939EE43|nr:sensor histidine kinase [Streptomyces sp. TSRI0107]